MTKWQSEYAEKLKDPRWQKLRLQVFERDGWKCLGCGSSKETLHVHHLIYRRGVEPWDAPMKELETLCWKCHEWREGFDAYWERKSAYPTYTMRHFDLFFRKVFSAKKAHHGWVIFESHCVFYDVSATQANRDVFSGIVWDYEPLQDKEAALESVPP